MCRFLMLQANKNFQPEVILEEFAEKCRESKNWQGDGWGVAWSNSKNGWEVRKTLTPIWEEAPLFKSLPQSTSFVVHARGASFPKHKDNLAYNQPFIKDSACFVFNGFVQKVRLKKKIPGKIGAQKIFHVLLDYLNHHPPEVALKKANKLMLTASKKIEGLNIGLSLGGRFYALCQFDNDPDYYSLHYLNDEETKLVCSEPLSSLNLDKMEKGQIITL